jgi:organic hydroperoxide reductase OsmC/OhrA
MKASLTFRQFGGQGDRWPPEQLLVASVAGCFRIHTHAKLSATSGTDWERAKHLLKTAESTCPISNSLNCQRELTVEVVEK